MTNQQTNQNEVANQESLNQLAPQVVKGEDGKFKRVATYENWASVKAETKEQKIKLFNLLNSDDEALPMKEHKGTKLKIADVIFQAYEGVDEDTGEIMPGVVSLIITQEGVPYVTSSKSVYFSLKNIFKAFGEPHYSKDEAVEVEIVEKKGQKFFYIDLKLIG